MTENDILYDIDQDNDVLMVKLKDHKIEIAIGFDEGEPTIRFGNISVTYDRKCQAKMLWAAAYLVDSGEIWREDKYVGRDYTELNS